MLTDKYSCSLLPILGALDLTQPSDLFAVFLCLVFVAFAVWTARSMESIHGQPRLRKTPQSSDTNARLIAAAPELLSALVRAKNWIATEPVEETLNDYDREIHLTVLNQINNAIKKATNEQ